MNELVSYIFFSKKLKILVNNPTIMKLYCDYYNLSSSQVNQLLGLDLDFNFGDSHINGFVNRLFFTPSSNFSEVLLSKFSGVNAKFINRNHCNIPFLSIPKCAPMTLEQAIEDRMAYFKKLAENKELILLWSGGIDSTLAFYSLNDADISFIVFCDENSQKEYPFLYDKIAGNEFKNVKMLNYDRQNLLKYISNPNYAFVTGELGDQTLGSMITMNFSFAERQMKLSEGIEKNIFLHVYNKQNSVNEDIPIFTQEIIDFCTEGVSEVIENYSLDDTTVSEFLWAENFVYKYAIVYFRLLSQNFIPCGPQTNVHHFYSSEKFQQYSLTHYKENCYFENLNNYKDSFKKMIFRHNKDRDYLKNKIKVPSLKDANFYRA